MDGGYAARHKNAGARAKMPHTRLPKAAPGDGPGTSDAGTVRLFRAAPGPKRRSRKCGRPFGANAPAAPVREKLPPFDERNFFRRPLLRRRWGAEGSGLRTGQMPCRSLQPQTPPKSRQSRPGPGPHVQTFLPQTCAIPGFFFHTPAIGAYPRMPVGFRQRRGDSSSGPSPASGRLPPAAGTCSPLSESQAVATVRHARLHRAFRRRLSAAVLPRRLSAVCLFCREPFSTRRRQSSKSPHRMTPRPFTGDAPLLRSPLLCHSVMRQREGGKRRRFFNMPGKIAFRKKKRLCAARRGIHAEAMPAAGCPPRKKMPDRRTIFRNVRLLKFRP